MRTRIAVVKRAPSTFRSLFRRFARVRNAVLRANGARNVALIERVDEHCWGVGDPPNGGPLRQGVRPIHIPSSREGRIDKATNSNTVLIAAHSVVELR